MVRPPLTQVEKEHLIRRKLAGASHREVAQELHCSTETVRKHWRDHRRQRNRQKRGRPAKGTLSTYAEEVRQGALKLKEGHPYWGPVTVLLELQRQQGKREKRMPSRSRLAVYFKEACSQALQPHRHPIVRVARKAEVTQVHQRWQMDTKEKIRLGDGENASVLDVRDPISAVMIASQAFLTGRSASTCRKLTLEEIRNALRQSFEVWGKPAEIQTDHEDVYAGASQSDFPMPFTLWLAGLGIEHVLSRRNRPTDQGQIERNHRTLAELGWKNHAPENIQDLQNQLDADRDRYNLEYPARAADCQGQPPLVRHPNALFSGRPFTTTEEWIVFCLEKVDAYLTRFHWVRKVDCNGCIFLGDHRYYLGRTFRTQQVGIRYLPDYRAFRFETEDGALIKTHPALGLEVSDLTGLIPLHPWVGPPVQIRFPWGV